MGEQSDRVAHAVVRWLWRDAVGETEDGVGVQMTGRGRRDALLYSRKGSSVQIQVVQPGWFNNSVTPTATGGRQRATRKRRARWKARAGSEQCQLARIVRELRLGAGKHLAPDFPLGYSSYGTLILT